MGCGVSDNRKYFKQSTPPEEKDTAPLNVKLSRSGFAKIEVPVSDLFDQSENSNNTAIFVPSLRAHLPKEEAEKPKAYIESFTAIRTYADSQFPADETSLSNKKTKQDKFKNIVWKSPELIYQNQSHPIFYKGTSPLDVKQGKLNNCYFISALCCLAEREELVSSLFPEIVEEDSSINVVWLNDSGEWKAVITDNNFPCDTNTGLPCFASCKVAELWVPILEKSYAKIYGSYENIEMGLSSCALKDLTGAPYEIYSFEEPDQAWEYLVTNFRKGYLITANLKNLQPNDLTSSHSYAILDLQEVATDMIGTKERLVKLRDPLNKKLIVSDWADNSSRWTVDLRERLKYSQDFDGVVWMSIGCFLKNFATGAVCKIHLGFEHSSLKMVQTEKRKQSVVLMTVSSKMKVYMTISQKDKRKFAQNPNSKYDYSLFSLMVAQIDGGFNLTRFIGGAFEKDRDVEVEFNIEPGNYLILTSFSWCQDEYLQFVLSCYAEGKVRLTEMIYKGEPQEITETFLKCYFKSNIDPLCSISYSNFGENSIKRYMKYVYGYLAVYYENPTDKTIFEEKMRMSDLEYLNICPPFNDSNEFTVMVQPKKDQLVMYTTDPKGEGAFKYKFKYWTLAIPNFDDTELKGVIQANASKKVQRNVNGQDIDVFVYTYPFKGGVCFLYWNKSKYMYMETLELRLENLVTFNGDAQNIFNFILKPGEDLIIKLKAKDYTLNYSFQSKTNFKVGRDE